MSGMWFGILSLLLLSCAASLPARADLETTSTLPEGVRSPKFIFGTYSGLADKYNSTGLLEGVTDQYHLDLSGRTLSKLNPDLKQLIDTLNNNTAHGALGDKLSLGTLEFKSSPTVSFFAPTFSYGWTPNLSFGFGIPVVHYRNEMSIYNGGVSNIAQMRQYINPSIPEEAQAFTSLETAANNLEGTVNQVLVSKGYLPVRTVDYTTLGDFQFSALYRYFQTPDTSLGVRAYVQLPTGHKHNPDDLVDTAIGGQPAVGAYSVHDFFLTNRLVLDSSVGYQANLQDSVEVRVPNGPDDFLPGPERKDTVRRRTGNSVMLEGGFRYLLSHPIFIGAFYDFTEKDPDWYDGDRGWNYAYLGTDTGSITHEIKATFQFSTTDWYSMKTFAVPFQFGFVYGNVFYAVNAASQISNQIYLRMFF